MRSLFSLSNQQKATKAVAPHSQKKKNAALRDYPTASPYNSSRNKTKVNNEENNQTIQQTPTQASTKEPIQQTPATKTPKIQINNDQDPPEETEQKSEQVPASPKQQKKVTRESLIQQYQQLAEEYEAELQRRDELREEKEITLDAIEMLYSNQIKLEKGIIPESMQEELNQQDKPDEEHNE